MTRDQFEPRPAEPREGDFRIVRVTFGDNRVRYALERCIGKWPSSPNAAPQWRRVGVDGWFGARGTTATYATERKARGAMMKAQRALARRRIIKREVLP